MMDEFLVEVRAMLFLGVFVAEDGGRAWKLRGNGGVVGMPRYRGWIRRRAAE